MRDVGPYPKLSGWPRWIKSPELLASLTDATVPAPDGRSIAAWTWMLVAAAGGVAATAVAVMVHSRRPRVPGAARCRATPSGVERSPDRALLQR